jgi:hypothetical protein
MTIESRIAGLFRLTDDNWMKHANPWSVRTRYSVLPFLILASWSRIWLGWWCIIPVVLALAWMVLNPVFFQKPASTKSWESRSVLGERVWANRDRVPVPDRHRRLPAVLNGISSLGMLLSIWGVIALSVWPAVMGVALAYIGKSWYLDRMVWLYEDMQHVPEYSAWLY